MTKAEYKQTIRDLVADAEAHGIGVAIVNGSTVQNIRPKDYLVTQPTDITDKTLVERLNTLKNGMALNLSGEQRSWLGAAADRIEALEAAGQWRPIETAPKDGTWFLIVNVDDDWPSMECGRYEPLMTDLFEEVGDGLYRKTRNSAYDWEGFSNFHRATHWFLIPQPPVPHD